MTVPAEDKEVIQNQIKDLELPLDFEKEPIGFLTLGGGEVIDLGLTESRKISQSFSAMRGANGVYITSHRKLFSYSKIDNIPTTASAVNEILNLYTEKLKSTYAASTRPQELVKAEEGPSYRMKQTLMALALFGEGNSVISPNHDSLDTFKGFEQVLRFVLPDEIGFERFHIMMPELYLVSKSGMFPLESLSGGAAAILDLSWQVFLASKVYSDFSVLIDEPENHLHPSLQKSLMPKLIDAFPSAQFIIATHSPLMINSEENSSVYVISSSGPGRYEARLLDFFNKASSSQDTLYQVLGVDGSAPAWATERLDAIIEKYEDNEDTVDAVKMLRQELVEAGLADAVTGALKAFLDRRDSDQA